MSTNTAEAMRNAVNGQFVSSANLMPGIRVLLEAAPDGVSEALLVHVCCIDDGPLGHPAKHVFGVTPNRDSQARRKVRSACNRLKAKYDKGDGKWRL